LEKLLEEASWLLSHAEALADYGRKAEAEAEWARAANCEERVACLLDAAGREQEAAVHRVSAASCYEPRGEWARTMTLLRAALSTPIGEDSRGRVEEQLSRCLAQARKNLGRAG
jgi:hypothetical protein